MKYRPFEKSHILVLNLHYLLRMICMCNASVVKNLRPNAVVLVWCKRSTLAKVCLFVFLILSGVWQREK